MSLPRSLGAYLCAALFSLVVSPACGTAQSGGYETLEPEAYRAAIDAAADPLVLDCRTPEEFVEGALPNALNYDYLDREFAYRVDSLPRDRPVFVYCASGGRSAQAAELLYDIGFEEVYNLEGGLRGAAEAAEATPEGGR